MEEDSGDLSYKVISSCDPPRKRSTKVNARESVFLTRQAKIVTNLQKCIYLLRKTKAGIANFFGFVSSSILYDTLNL